MKKITGIIVLIILLVLIGFGFTYKMVEPDGWDRIVDKVVEQVPVLENIIPEKTPKPTPTPTPEGTAGNSQQNVSNPTATSTPTPTPAATQMPSVSPTPTPEVEVDFENMTYEIYVKLPAEIQEEYFETYDDPMDFINWYNTTKEEYEKNNPVVEGDGVIDLGDYINSSSSNGN